MYDLFVDGMSYVAQSTSSSVSSGRASRDVLWERALSALPPVLRSALRAAELDDPQVLSEYPVESQHDLEESVGGKVEIGCAPSGAASTSHPPLSSSHSCSLPTGPSGSGSSWTADAAETGKGGDPRTDHSLPVGMAHGTREGGGDPKTDHSLSVGMARRASAILVGVSPHTGGLATQTAIPSPACTDLGISTGLTHDAEVRDGCPSIAEDSVHPDGLTTISQDPDHRDAFPISDEPSECRGGFPSSGDTEYSDTIFTGFSHWRKLRTSPRVGSRSSNRPR